ncbi:MAG: DUF1848 domain-containing protein [Spirochaetaceae bacterium]|jgi:hypothetical protein|nr:DUF1848 domain-containing protein [Spirochaetaceae bacterium]
MKKIFKKGWSQVIISASRRTDIPSYYAEWFFKRLRERYVLVRNPMNIHQISKVSLLPDVVDCIVFWTKNPRPMLDKLQLLAAYPYYFQFTLNSYAQDIEAGLPGKQAIIDTFQKLSDTIGAEKVIWRYDPLLINEKYTIFYHVENFGTIAHALRGYAKKVTISFIDFYSKITKNLNLLDIHPMSAEDKDSIAKQLSAIARENCFAIDTCAEDINLSQYGISHARCIDDRLIEQIIGCPLSVGKDKTQRLKCACVASVDIGAYNSCANACLYCYANDNRKRVEENRKQHSPDSPLLIGEVRSDDVCTERCLGSNKKSPLQAAE